MNVPSFQATAGLVWRTKRPYIGATFLVTSGVVVAYAPFGSSLELLPTNAASTVIGLVIGGLIFLTGLFALARPEWSTVLGMVGVVFSIFSVVSTFGGLIIGLIFGNVGGYLLIAWEKPDLQRSRDTNDFETVERNSKNGVFRREKTYSVLSGPNVTGKGTHESRRTATYEDDLGENRLRFAWQSDPYARESTTESEIAEANDVPKAESKKDVHEDKLDASEELWDEFLGHRDSAISENSVAEGISQTEDTTHTAEGPSSSRVIAPFGREKTTENPPVEARLDDALERVAHGAIVSFPSLLFTKTISFATTSVLTNGFSGSSYGLYVLASKFVAFLRNPTSGLLTGLNRFLPSASNDERDVFATAVSLLMMGIGTVLGAGLFLIAPHLTRALDYGHQFQLFLRIFAVWFPGSLWLQTIETILESIEEVGALNVFFRFVFPVADFAAVVLGTFILQNFVAVVLGQVLIGALITVVLTGWVLWRLEFVPRIRGVNATRLRQKYIRYSTPLVGRKIVMTFNGAILYVLIAVFLSSVAAGVFAVGILVSSLVSFPLSLNNQFISPVVADLYDRDDHEALVRLYQVTTRLILVASTGLAIPLLVHRGPVMRLFGQTFAEYAYLLPVFIFAQFVGSVVGSDTILLTMTDRQRATLWIQFATGLVFVLVAIPLTIEYGLLGLVATYLLKTVMANSLEILALYHLNGYFPFTWLHLKPLLAGLAFLVIVLSGKFALSGPTAQVIATVGGLVVYGTILYVLGFTRAERRLAESMFARYRESVSRLLT